MKQTDSILILAGKLFLICMVIALGLSALNYVTAPVIAQFTQRAKIEAMEAVLPGCDMEQVNDAVYVGKKDGQVHGYVVNITTQEGYGGAIEMMIGFDKNSNITGLEFISMSETPGLGARAKEDSFTAQFIGQPARDFSEIEALTGATVTSKAVNGAIAAAAQMVKEVAE